MKLYIDTSVFGGYFEPEFELWSKNLFNQIIEGSYTAAVSDITLLELENAPKKVLKFANSIISQNAEFLLADVDARLLADYYLKEKIITARFHSDALHIAIATINKIDVLTSWNFKHIVNLNRIRLYNSVNLKYGYSMIEIRSPRDIIET
ncbi:MAG: PIN domain protein [Bacteroidia bacterium]